MQQIRSGLLCEKKGAFKGPFFIEQQHSQLLIRHRPTVHAEVRCSRRSTVVQSHP